MVPMRYEASFQVGDKRVFKGVFIHLIGCEHDQDLGPPFSHVFKQVGHWSTYLEKTPMEVGIFSKCYVCI